MDINPVILKRCKTSSLFRIYFCTSISDSIKNWQRKERVAYLQSLAVGTIEVTRMSQVQERSTDHQVSKHCGYVWKEAPQNRDKG